MLKNHKKKYNPDLDSNEIYREKKVKKLKKSKKERIKYKNFIEEEINN